MYTAEKPKFLDILRLIPVEGCTRAKLCKNTIRSKDYVSMALKYWKGEDVITLRTKPKDPRYLWIEFTAKGVDVKRIYDIFSTVMDLKTKEFTNG